MAILTHALPPRAARLAAIAGLSLSLLALAGCANQTASSSVYTYGQAQQEQIVRYGTVVSVRPVVIQSDKSSGVGALGGAALGGVAGSAIGGGRGQILTSIGGALLGGLAGNAIENQVGKTNGLEITVRLDNGETRVIAQAADVALSSGQRVQVISGGGPTRVVPM
ncbi:glycine zipper 2TM domain-containing protein [Castellaniella denitrificans]|uniref:Glycine zipper 2TM domain-containing protein n=1 Tax=Castellaniella denitrificans TaxID=56119 RepID=A0ABT4M1R6_9BURK|nr:glycine zipper 2TM domain-containing protein [Castellaniella denitrificans]MCZ4328410.1 glycine zipper 2TM domain-containing protein [Castellaniella denitrificans]